MRISLADTPSYYMKETYWCLVINARAGNGLSQEEVIVQEAELLM